MNIKRLTELINRLTRKTVLGELLEPALEAWLQVRRPNAGARVLGMDTFITLGVLRHLQGMKTLREQVQSLLHLSADTESRPPLARSTWSDALSSSGRLAVLEEMMPRLVKMARSVLPDRLAGFSELSDRAVYAVHRGTGL